MIFPLVGTLIVGAAFVCLFGAIAGKVLHVHWTIAFAIAICCTIGYPGTQIIVDEVVRSLHCDEPTRVKIYEHVAAPDPGIRIHIRYCGIRVLRRPDLPADLLILLHKIYRKNIVLGKRAAARFAAVLFSGERPALVS